jgi:DNA polymerase V
MTSKKRGGARVGAGRPVGSTTKEPTKPLRVPVALIPEIKRLIQNPNSTKLPFFGSNVRAGFPSPADDYIEDHLDLNEYLIKHPAATFLVRAKGKSMSNASIKSGDILIVDRSIEPIHGKIVIAAVNGELTVKRLYLKQGVTKLVPEHPDFPDIILNADTEVIIWGVVTSIIHQVE